MPRYTSADHHMLEVVEWDPAKPAERINDHILMSRSTSNAYLVTTDDGDVVINTGMPYQGVRTRERFETLLGRPLNVKKILLTQSHPDHMGGWTAFNEPGTETVITYNFPFIQRERSLLDKYFAPRGARIIGNLMPNPEHLKAWQPEANASEFERATRYLNHHAFDLGGRRFELFAAPSGETLDSQMVWMPNEKTVFIGNWAGALYGAMPHFYSPRGERQRSVPQFLRDIDHLIGLGAELLITGHDDPVVGADRVRADLTKLRDAVRHLHDETVKGMSELKDLFTLMQEITLPPHLEMAPGRGPLRWYVRAIFEEYTGWFRQESTTELYAVPPRAVWADLAEMAGGPDALAARAQAHVENGRPVEALHLIDIALSVNPGHAAARQTEIVALEELLDRTGGKPHDEISWLETKIREAKAAIRAG